MRQARLRQRMSDKMTRCSLMVLLAQYAATLPLYIGTTYPPPLVIFHSFRYHCLYWKVGAIPQLPGITIPIGHFVAAFVEDVWILGEIKVPIICLNPIKLSSGTNFNNKVFGARHRRWWRRRGRKRNDYSSKSRHTFAKFSSGSTPSWACIVPKGCDCVGALPTDNLLLQRRCGDTTGRTQWWLFVSVFSIVNQKFKSPFFKGCIRGFDLLNWLFTNTSSPSTLCPHTQGNPWKK